MEEFVEFEREKALTTVKEYCEDGYRHGGVLLVCGQRGVGKTRLVDEALNEKSEHHLLHSLFGDHNGRKRRLCKRQPRGMQRQLIKVEVDPHFPLEFSSEVPCATVNLNSAGADNLHSTTGTTINNNVSSAPVEKPAPSSATYQLLRNIIFALTAHIDPRASLRRHGRTLRSRFGFRDYWFGRYAFWDPGHQARIWIDYISFFLLFILGVQYVFDKEYMFTLSLLVAIPLAKIFLTRLDYLAVGRLSSQLYDLVHSQDFDKEGKDHKAWNIELKNKWQIGLSILILFAAFFSISIDLNSIGKGKLTPDGEHYDLYLSILIGLFGGMLFLVTFTKKHAEQRISHFGQKNPVWMVTQLRRYLFLLHRCGIEPVLVFDELDKLTESELNDFLDAMKKLRLSVGADFLSILIGDNGLYLRYLRERHPEHAELGPLATLVQEQVHLGPVSPETLEQSLRQKAAIGWVRSRGIYAAIKETGELKPGCENQLASVLAASAKKLWAPENLLSRYDIFNDHRYVSRMRDPWVVNNIHAGMGQFAEELIRGAVNLTHASILGNDSVKSGIAHFDKIDLLNDDSERLQKLGRFLWYQWLIEDGVILRKEPGQRFGMQRNDLVRVDEEKVSSAQNG